MGQLARILRSITSEFTPKPKMLSTKTRLEIMGHQEKITYLKESLKEAEKVQAELDLRVFNLKTLYDVSKDIYGSVESETIIRNFLLMTMGNFGVLQGFILLQDEHSNTASKFVSIGFQDTDTISLEKKAVQVLRHENSRKLPENSNESVYRIFLPHEVEFAIPFALAPDCPGLLGLGSKLIGEPYNNNDIELIHLLTMLV